MTFYLLWFILSTILASKLSTGRRHTLPAKELLKILGNGDIGDSFNPNLNRDVVNHDVMGRDFFKHNVVDRDAVSDPDSLDSTHDRSDPLSWLRKAVRNTDDLWQRVDGVPSVLYAYGNSPVPHETIQAAISHIENHTCIRFRESQNISREGRIVFRNGGGCSSNVGRWPWSASGDQPVTLGFGCNKVTTVIHELGHALGLYHEHCRSDRDDFIDVLEDNLASDVGYTKTDTNNFYLDYDYTSLMHYGQFSFSKNGQPTLTPHDPLKKGLTMVPRFGLSFMDKSALNNLYGCIDYWVKGCGLGVTDPCENNGYTGAECKCICPSGTTGEFCEGKEKEYTDALVALLLPQNAVITEETTITSEISSAEYEAFTKLIKGPPGHKITLVVHEFDLFSRLPVPGTCYFEGVEVGTPRDMVSSNVYCETDLQPDQLLKIDSNELYVFYWRENHEWLTTRGFNFTVQFEIR